LAWGDFDGKITVGTRSLATVHISSTLAFTVLVNSWHAERKR
jgi:hypothetical protein